MNKRIWGAMAVAVLLAMTFSSAGAGPIGDVRGSHDGALLTFEPGPAIAVYMSLNMWGTGMYDGIPPEEVAGLGDREICLGIFMSDEQEGDTHANTCSSDIEFEIDRLESARVEASITLELTQGDGTPIVFEDVAVDVLLEGEGPRYPGARAQLNAAPGVEAELSWQRAATVTGTVSSDTFGIIELTGAGGILLSDECRALMLGRDHSETCRF